MKKKLFRLSKSKNKNGFVLLESLCGLLCTSVCILLLILMIQTTQSLLKQSEGSQEQLAILDIRSKVAMSFSAHIQNGVLFLDENDPSQIIEFHHNRLVARPGYMILMEEIESALFKEEDGSLWLEFVKAGVRRKVWIQ